MLRHLWWRWADQGCDLCRSRRRTSGWPGLQRTGPTSCCPLMSQTCLSVTHHLACDWLWISEWEKKSLLLVFFMCLTLCPCIFSAVKAVVVEWGRGWWSALIWITTPILRITVDWRANPLLWRHATTSHVQKNRVRRSKHSWFQYYLLEFGWGSNKCNLSPVVPSVQDPGYHGSTIRGYVPHVPEVPSGM